MYNFWLLAAVGIWSRLHFICIRVKLLTTFVPHSSITSQYSHMIANNHPNTSYVTQWTSCHLTQTQLFFTLYIVWLFCTADCTKLIDYLVLRTFVRIPQQTTNSQFLTATEAHTTGVKQWIFSCVSDIIRSCTCTRVKSLLISFVTFTTDSNQFLVPISKTCTTRTNTAVWSLDS